MRQLAEAQENTKATSISVQTDSHEVYEQSELIRELRRNLVEMQDLQNRLDFMMREIKYLMKL